jgi:putative FmdB family regulatory protein
MPIYEYQCKSCKKVTEKMQKFSDAPLTNCPECKGELEKLLSLTSFSLKGTGWYATDYKKSSAPKTEKSTPSAAPATDSNSSTSPTTPAQVKSTSDSSNSKAETKSTSSPSKDS